MSVFTKFTIEGEATLGYFADEPGDRDRSVRIKSDDDSEGSGRSDAPVAVGAGPESVGDRVESLIARSLGFPNEGEFNDLSERMQALREQGLQAAEGIPDIMREGTRLRITVEVVDD